MIPKLRSILTSHGDISRCSWFDTSLAIHVLYFSEIKDFANNNKTEEVRVPAVVSYEISDEEELDITVSC